MNRFKAMCKQTTLAADAAAWVQERGTEVGLKDLRQVTAVNEPCRRLKFKDWGKAVDLLVAASVMNVVPPPLQSDEEKRLAQALKAAEDSARAHKQVEQEKPLLSMRLEESQRRERDASELATLHRKKCEAQQHHNAKRARREASKNSSDEEPLQDIVKYKVGEYKCVRIRANVSVCGWRQWILGGPAVSSEGHPGGPSQCAQCYLECAVRGTEPPSMDNACWDQTLRAMSLDKFQRVKARSLGSLQNGLVQEIKPTAAKSAPATPAKAPSPPRDPRILEPAVACPEPRAATPLPLSPEKISRAEGAHRKAQQAMLEAKRSALAPVPEEDESDLDEYEEPPLLAQQHK